MIVLRVELPLFEVEEDVKEDVKNLSGKEIVNFYVKLGLIPQECVYANDPRIENDILVFELMVAAPLNQVVRIKVENIPIEGSDYQLLFEEDKLLSN